ncbi:MAG: hypothetical protein C0404_07285 [Verrucomicrobia bacterium]|nr:hypothetical protein [Verrucomicrobiota bacterium]
MNIGISAQLLRSHPTGVEMYVFNLIRHLVAADATNRYFIYCYDNELTRRLESSDNAVLRKIPLPPSRALRVAFEQFRLPGLLHKDGIDVYHSPAYIIPLLTPSSIPTVVSIFDVFAITRPGFCRLHNRLYYRMVLPHAVRKADRIITLSQLVKDDIISTFQVPAGKIVVNYPGIDQPRPGATGIDGRFILHVGNFDPKKNIPFLIRAFERLKAVAGIPHKLVLAGEQSWQYSEVLQMANASRYANDIIFTGYVPEDRKWALYRDADLFVFPSLFEGFGFPPIEAAASGTRVLVSDIPIFRETIPDAAFFRPNDLDSCVSQMQTLLAGLPRQFIDLSRYSFETHARQCIALYKELAG